MKLNMKITVVIIFILHALSCDKGNNGDDVLSLERQDYVGNELMIKGIYFHEVQTSRGVRFERYALYINGVMRHLGIAEQPNSPKISSGENKRDWGVFQVTGDQFMFERWYPSSGWISRAFVRSGVILNDTTFHITESYRLQDGVQTEISERNEIYHFRAFSPKPDSTNSFVE